MRVGQILLALLICVGTVFTMSVPDAKAFQNEALARIIFWHLPAALVCTLFLLAAPYFAFRYLKTKDFSWDLRATAATEIGMLTGMITLITGIIFSDVQWGAPWSWDPRQTSFLLVMLIVGAFFALRAAFSDREKRASNSAAYLLASVLPILFLIFVFPRVLMSLHPDVVRKGGFDSTYNTVFLSMFVLFFAVNVWMYKLRVGAGLLEETLEDSIGELAVGGDPAPSGVVRRVSVHDEGR